MNVQKKSSLEKEFLTVHYTPNCEASIPSPNIPEPNPEIPSPKIPNPEPVPKPKNGTVSDDMPKEVYTCKFCGKSFDTKEDLELHIRTQHKSSK
jgi:hypothetical protein